MTIIYKFLFFVGILSFFGGIVNGKIFVFGLIIATIFGYLGYVRKNNTNESTFLRKPNPDSDNHFFSNVEDLHNKKTLLERAYKNGVITDVEFEEKQSQIQKSIDYLNMENKNYRDQKKLQDFLHQNFQKHIDELDILLKNQLISEEEYASKIFLLTEKAWIKLNNEELIPGQNQQKKTTTTQGTNLHINLKLKIYFVLIIVLLLLFVVYLENKT